MSGCRSPDCRSPGCCPPGRHSPGWCRCCERRAALVSPHTAARQRACTSHRTRTNHGFAALSVNGSYRFYDVDILTGQAAGVGAFPKAHQVTDVALPLNQS
ncbi:hypothetical protein [Streptomyces sp. CNS654]|uniref:hypothetical protein n=1 Tax=Streptomyces sp. CNS654 TaxID=1506995 RepID=UPI001319CBE8|nr:hypothetical protein [Streptomyces sp. CNS654]